MAEATTREKTLNALCQVYELGAAQLSMHYQKVKNRFPQILQYEIIVNVKEDGRAEMRGRRVLRAGGKNVQHFLIDYFAGTTPLASFMDLGFKYEVHSKHAVACFPTRGKPSFYEVLYAFLPPLRADDPDLDFSVMWGWPDVFRDLIDPNKRRDDFEITVRTAAKIPLVRLVFQIHSAIPSVKLSNKGTAGGTVVGTPLPQFAFEDYRIYQWEAQDVADEAQVAVWLEWA